MARQTECLQQEDGHKFMRQWFDYFPPLVRKRLAASDFNICAACLGVHWGITRADLLLAAIDEMEAELRKS